MQRNVVMENICNLRIMPSKDNFLKNKKYDIFLEDLKRRYDERKI
jgi:hypothetical protein